MLRPPISPSQSVPPRLGRELLLGGTNGHGDAETALAGLALYSSALSGEDVGRAMLHNRLTNRL